MRKRGRPKKYRIVKEDPRISQFSPRGRPGRPDEIDLAMDEFEAIRLADLEGLYQDQAAERMNISRQTFGRIIDSAHKKVAEALVEGKALRIEGGRFEMNAVRKFKCDDCQHAWEVPHGTGRPTDCPSCRSANIHREEDR